MQVEDRYQCMTHICAVNTPTSATSAALNQDLGKQTADPAHKIAATPLKMLILTIVRGAARCQTHMHNTLRGEYTLTSLCALQQP